MSPTLRFAFREGYLTFCNTDLLVLGCAKRLTLTWMSSDANMFLGRFQAATWPGYAGLSQQLDARDSWMHQEGTSL